MALRDDDPTTGTEECRPSGRVLDLWLLVGRTRGLSILAGSSTKLITSVMEEDVDAESSDDWRERVLFERLLSCSI
jgi:hypothetical protein